MGCGSTEEKPNEINPEQIIVTSGKDKIDNKEKQENSANQNKILVMKQQPKSKAKIKKFIEDALQKHNELRKEHGSGPLILSEDLNKIAQEYSEYLAKIDEMKHSKNTYKGDDLGENLFCCSGTEIQGEYMTMSWYNEINDYDFNNPGFKSGTGHFTQLIWKDTEQVGFGFSYSKSGKYYGVANYYPAGNINTKEEFSKNVLKKL